jgi:hypothetical protein
MSQSSRLRARRANRIERAARRGAEHRHCYQHALEGRPPVRATVGELCSEHFNSVDFHRKW